MICRLLKNCSKDRREFSSSGLSSRSNEFEIFFYFFHLRRLCLLESENIWVRETVGARQGRCVWGGRDPHLPSIPLPPCPTLCHLSTRASYSDLKKSYFNKNLCRERDNRILNHKNMDSRVGAGPNVCRWSKGTNSRYKVNESYLLFRVESSSHRKLAGEPFTRQTCAWVGGFREAQEAHVTGR